MADFVSTYLAVGIALAGLLLGIKAARSVLDRF